MTTGVVVTVCVTTEPDLVMTWVWMMGLGECVSDVTGGGGALEVIELVVEEDAGAGGGALDDCGVYQGNVSKFSEKRLLLLQADCKMKGAVLQE